MMYRISKEFHFSASHRLEGLREGHPCGRLHGHNYIFKVILASEALDEHGFVVDYGDLWPIKDWIDNDLDHRHLNDVLPIQPTAENIARFMAERISALIPTAQVTVAISETPKTWAEWTHER